MLPRSSRRVLYPLFATGNNTLKQIYSERLTTDALFLTGRFTTLHCRLESTRSTVSCSPNFVALHYWQYFPCFLSRGDECPFGPVPEPILSLVPSTRVVAKIRISAAASTESRVGISSRVFTRSPFFTRDRLQHREFVARVNHALCPCAKFPTTPSFQLPSHISRDRGPQRRPRINSKQCTDETRFNHFGGNSGAQRRDECSTASMYTCKSSLALFATNHHDYPCRRRVWVPHRWQRLTIAPIENEFIRAAKISDRIVTQSRRFL